MKKCSNRLPCEFTFKTIGGECTLSFSYNTKFLYTINANGTVTLYRKQIKFSIPYEKWKEHFRKDEEVSE